MVRATILAVCLLTGCNSSVDGGAIASSSADDGSTGGDGPSDAGDDAGDSEDSGAAQGAAPVPMRRLTRAQFVQSTRDLLAIPDWSPEGELPDDGLNHEEYQLPNMQASVLSTTGEDYEKYRALAKEAAELALATDDEMSARMGCTPAAPDDACVRDYLMTTAERAFSRVVPSDDPVLASLLAVVEEGYAQLGSVRLGVQWALVSLVQCPEFLYVYPAADPERDGVMDGYSRARVVALMFRDSIPDDALLARARAGELGDDAVLRDEIDRLIAEMVAEPSRRVAVERFFSEWWGTNVVDAIGKDPVEFPEFDDALRTSMREEIDAWLADIVFDSRGDFHRMLVSDRLWVDDELAALYGIPGVFGSTPQPVTIDADNPRSGLLSTAAFSSIMAHPSQTSPAARGRFVTERLLCGRIPPVPPGVDTTIPPPEGPETKRQRFVRHTSDPTCATCHALMDPMGLALEEFDGIGRHRRTETVVFDGETYEVPLDTTGEIGGVAFADSKQMAALVADDPRFIQCVTQQLLNHALGRELTAAEQPALADIGERFAESGYDYLVLMREAAVHQIFTAFEEGV
ncbi:MAG: DUF1588 domain-containing protein [Deltaproteobacteria bacterium]|nr:DUF1588 domain-containing protein [Nannocystaceae bacterium]